MRPPLSRRPMFPNKRIKEIKIRNNNIDIIKIRNIKIKEIRIFIR